MSRALHSIKVERLKLGINKPTNGPSKNITFTLFGQAEVKIDSTFELVGSLTS
ncbi:hypothetical protein ACFLUO_04735 [Chloroflexota bacterium]